MSFSLIYICCSFRVAFYLLFFHCSHAFLTCREPGVPLSLFRSYPLPFSPPFLLYCSLPFPSFSSMSVSLIYICCSFRGGILSVVFPTVAICFWPAGNLECPCLFSDLILFPFLLLFFYIVPYPSFSSMSFSLIYICCCFRRHSICCFPHCSHMFLTRREPGVPLSLFRPYPLPFSPPFLLYCSLPFLFF